MIKYLLPFLFVLSCDPARANEEATQASPAPVVKHRKRKHPLYLPLDTVIPKEKKESARAKKKTPRVGLLSFGEIAPTEEPAVDLRKYDSEVIEQYRGDCTAQGSSAAADNLMRRQDPKADVSQESLWAWYGVYNVYDALTAFNKNFVKEEAGWPFGQAMKLPEWKGRYKLKEYKELDNDPEAAWKYIKKGNPVIWAGSVSRGMAGCLKTTPGQGVNGEPTKGGHVVAVVGGKREKGELFFLMKQQWGTDCGDKGYQWISADTCFRSGAYCLFFPVMSVEDKLTGKVYSIDATPSPTPAPSTLPIPIPTPACICK